MNIKFTLSNHSHSRYYCNSLTSTVNSPATASQEGLFEKSNTYNNLLFNDLDNCSVSISPILQSFMAKYAAGKPKAVTKSKRYNGTVDPIKSPMDIQAAKNYFLEQIERYPNSLINIRNYLLFVLGINCARRIGDLLKFRVCDFVNIDGSFYPHFAIKEEKTGKPIKIKINRNVQEALSLYLQANTTLSQEDFLFTSRKGTNKPMKTRSISKIIKAMSIAIGLDQRGININTHSMRKTWAYHAYQQDPTQIIMIQKALNHSSPSVTLRYIGIEQEDMDKLFDGINL